MPRHLFLLALALLLTACGSRLGLADAALVGQWQASETSGGETWTFRDDGTFTAEGSPQKSLAGSGSHARSGRWGVKDDVLALDFTTLAAREKPAYAWKIEAGRLLLSKPGNTAPSLILDRTK